MGALVKVIDSILLVFFAVIAVLVPLINAQACLPASLFPEFLVELKRWYECEYGDYLFVQKPHFFVRLVWLELLFQWPLILANLCGILRSKPWFNSTCLIYGVSLNTALAAILSELIGSGKASDKLLILHYSFLGLGVLAMLRVCYRNLERLHRRLARDLHWLGQRELENVGKISLKPKQITENENNKRQRILYRFTNLATSYFCRRKFHKMLKKFVTEKSFNLILCFSHT